MLDRLTLDQLRTLAAVAETGSFSAAGRRLSRVQSAVSQTIQALEDTLGLTLFDRSEKTPKLTDAGKVILEDAKHLLNGAARLRARAESITDDVEPELTLALDAMFPNDILMVSLKALTHEFPHLPVSVFTEGLGGAEQRLLDGAARIAFYSPRMQRTNDLENEFLAGIEMVPVAAADHALAHIKTPITREMLEEQVQLVLTDRTQITAGFVGGVISRRIWRFADLGTRLEYLLAGFGWCNMPLHMVEVHIKAKRLKQLPLSENATWTLPIHAIHHRNHPPGRAGRWLMEDLRSRLGQCPADGSVKTRERR